MHTVCEAMKELRELGYLHLVASRENGVMQGHTWHWFEEPLSEEEFKKCFRKGGFPALGDFSESEALTDIRIPSNKNTNSSKEDKKDNVSAARPQPKKKLQKPTPSKKNFVLT